MLSSNTTDFQKTKLDLIKTTNEFKKNQKILLEKKYESEQKIRKLLINSKIETIRASNIYKEKLELINSLERNKLESIKKNGMTKLWEIRDKQNLINKNYSFHNFKPSLINHGFTGFIFEKNDEKYIGFTLHTTKKTFNLLNYDVPNILIDEKLNPIKYVNPLQVMKIENFKKYYEISSPEKMLLSDRYGDIENYDLAYCAYRAGWKSITQGIEYIEFRDLTYNENNKLIKWSQETTIKKDLIIVDENGISKIPSQILFTDTDLIDSEIYNEIKLNVKNMENNNYLKEKLVDNINETYKENFLY